MNRREFLHSSAALGAALYIAPSSASARRQSRNDTINVALLGAGAEGQILMNDILKLGKISGIRFKAVCDIWKSYNRRRASGILKAYGHQNNTYTDYREMLDKEKDLDAVIIATPDFWHEEHTVACLEAGLHVYCEKEMSNTIEGARRMLETARKTGKLLQIGHQRRSNPRYIHCYNKIIKEADLLNRITTIQGQWNRSRAACELRGWGGDRYAIDKNTLEKYGYQSMQQFRNWRWYKGLGGGPIVDLGSHQIDVYNWFLGARPKAVTASGGTDYWTGREWYDNVMAIYEYQTAKGKVRAYYQTITTNSSNGYYENFMGDEGTLVISEASNRGSVYRENWVKEDEWEKWVKKGYLKKTGGVDKQAAGVADVRASVPAEKYDLNVEMDKPYHLPHLENFFAAVRGREKLNCPAETGFETAVTVLKVNQAVEQARRLNFKPEEFEV